METQEATIKKANDKLQKVQSRMKDRHDQGIQEREIEKGALVYNKVQRLLKKGTARKLQKKYEGPYIVISTPSKHTAVLKHLITGKVVPRPVSVIHLKPINTKYSEEYISRHTDDGLITEKCNLAFV
jgi:hypothetical protein